jgi:hypothetical protein
MKPRRLKSRSLRAHKQSPNGRASRLGRETRSAALDSPPARTNLKRGFQISSGVSNKRALIITTGSGEFR